MKKGIVSVVGLCGLLLLGGNALACEVAGPNKHVGPVTAVDNDAATFTILDAETRAPITFAASNAILRDVSRAKGQVMVSYQDEGGKLVAVDVHF
jgi:hypothetical protein